MHIHHDAAEPRAVERIEFAKGLTAPPPQRYRHSYAGLPEVPAEEP